MRLASRAKDLTTFISPFGKYRFKRMPFGLKNAPAVFQALMEKVLASCKGFARVYIDDVLVYSDSWEEHMNHITKVLSALCAAGLTAKPAKCQWGRKYLDYLGHRVGGGQLCVPEYRVQAMKDYLQPVTRKDLRAFLGSVGYYRRFIDGFAKLSSSLTPATSVRAPGRIQWTPDMLDAFHSLRKSLCNFCVLNVPCSHDKFILHTDASGRGIGSVLNVFRDGEALPVAFYSRQLRGAETRYSATELEALAVVSSVQHFVHYLYGCNFVVMTDHRPLTALLTSKVLNRRLQGMVFKLLEFDITIMYREGKNNDNADGLSRQAWRVEKKDTPLTHGDCHASHVKHDLCRGECGARPHDGNKDSAGSTETHGDRPGTRSGNKLLEQFHWLDGTIAEVL